MSIWREPAEESHEYPGLCVDDGRVTGSITAGCSRLPLWAFVANALDEGWLNMGYDPDRYGWTAEKMGAFLYCLLEQRGEFGRLLVILADVERRTEGHDWGWWEKKSSRQRVLKQLERCITALRDSPTGRS